MQQDQVSFGKAIQKKYYNYIFVPSEVYVSIENVLSTYNCEDKTYIVAGPDQFYGDFEKCRIIRHPISSLNVGDVLNDKWSIDEYIKKNEAADIDISKAKVLVVDDNGVNLKVASGLFNAYNNKIDTAKSGEAALNKLKDSEYDIVFMDMVMPGLSGEDTLKQMRASDKKSTKEVPVIALTASVGGNIREEILDKGFQEYIAKPIKQRYLTTVLINFLPPELIHNKVKEKPADKDVEAPEKEKAKQKSGRLKQDKDVMAFIRAVKEMDLNALNEALDNLSTKNFDPDSDEKIKEAREAFSFYDFKRLKTIAEGLI